MDRSNNHSVFAISLLNLIPSLKNGQRVSYGLNEHLSSRLCQFSISDLDFIASRASRYLTVCVDAPELERVLAEISQKKEDEMLQDELLSLHATFSMMRELFGMHTTEFSARRKSLGLAGIGQHRPQSCNEETENAIWNAWQKYYDLDIRRRYLNVANVTEQPLNVVWSAVKRYQV